MNMQKNIPVIFLLLFVLMVQGCMAESGARKLLKSIEPVETGAGKYDKVDIQGNSPLILSITKEDKGAFLFLLENGADPNFRKQTTFDRSKHVKSANPQHFSPYHHSPLTAAAMNTNLFYMKKLLEFGANPDSDGFSGMSALIVSINYKNWDGVRVLVEAGADVNYLGENQFETPLMAAAASWKFDEVLYLLDKGADWRAVSPNGYTLAHVLNMPSGDSPAKQKVIAFLKEHGVDLPLPDPPRKPYEGYAKNYAQALEKFYRDTDEYNEIITKKFGPEARIDKETGRAVNSKPIQFPGLEKNTTQQ